MQYFLIFLSVLIGILGMILVIVSFKTTDQKKGKKTNQKKYTIIGLIGVILLFCTSSIIIYVYSLQPVSDRIIKEYKESENKSLPDLG